MCLAPDLPHLEKWLSHTRQALEGFKQVLLFDKPWPRQDQLSQKNVLLQLHHLQSYELVRTALKQNRLHLHGWWFDIEEVEIYAYNQQENKFKVIDEAEAETIQSLLTGSD